VPDYRIEYKPSGEDWQYFARVLGDVPDVLVYFRSNCGVLASGDYRYREAKAVDAPLAYVTLTEDGAVVCH
jgi:hypothetical protein